MSTWLRLGAGVGVIAMAAMGCSSGPLPNADVSEFCQSKATAECQVVAASCMVSSSACIDAREAVCETDAKQAMASGTRTYAQPNAAACIAAVQAAWAQPPVSFGTLQSVDATCEQVFPGSVAVKGSCKTDYDCANACPAGAPAATCSVCSPEMPGLTTTICAAAQPVTQAMGACANVGSVCPTGTYCTGVPAYCQPGGTAASGKTCTPPSVNCATGEYCQINAGATSGVCIALGSTGAACTTDDNCSATAPYCDLNVPPSGGTAGEGSCEVGLFSSFGTDSDDCKAFGAGS